jgi:hypothetical protein
MRRVQPVVVSILATRRWADRLERRVIEWGIPRSKLVRDAVDRVVLRARSPTSLYASPRPRSPTIRRRGSKHDR